MYQILMFPYDILGNPRYGITDIGAYEFMFSLLIWQGDDSSTQLYGTIPITGFGRSSIRK